MSQIEVEKIADGCPVRLNGEGGGYGESHRQHHQVIAVDLQRALPKADADAGRVLLRLVNAEATHQQRRNYNKSSADDTNPKGLFMKSLKCVGRWVSVIQTRKSPRNASSSGRRSGRLCFI